MKKAYARYFGWAIRWESRNRLDGHQIHFIGSVNIGKEPPVSGHRYILFATREQARRYVKDKYGYIAKRPDLKREPHGWTMPKIVRASTTMEELA